MTKINCENCKAETNFNVKIYVFYSEANEAHAPLRRGTDCEIIFILNIVSVYIAPHSNHIAMLLYCWYRAWHSY